MDFKKTLYKDGFVSFDEIALKLNLSRARVFQIYKQAIKKLKHPKNKDKWLAIFETINLLEKERVNKNNSIQGEKK